MAKYNNDSTERLFDVITKISTKEECQKFLEDICTIKEIQDMAQRLDTAILLEKGYSYQKIAEIVGASSATISRVNRCLVYGSGGYKEALNKMSDDDKKKVENGLK